MDKYYPPFEIQRWETRFVNFNKEVKDDRYFHCKGESVIPLSFETIILNVSVFRGVIELNINEYFKKSHSIWISRPVSSDFPSYTEKQLDHSYNSEYIIDLRTYFTLALKYFLH